LSDADISVIIFNIKHFKTNMKKILKKKINPVWISLFGIALILLAQMSISLMSEDARDNKVALVLLSLGLLVLLAMPIYLVLKIIYINIKK